MNISTLRPGLLVSLSVRTSGNVQYSRRDIEADHIEDDGTLRAKWETDRIIENPEEHDRANKVRSKARSLVTSVCSPSNFGLLCPERDREKLTDAMAAAREIVDEFNRSASITQVSVFLIVGRVAADDVEAVRAINGEIRDLLTMMERGLEKLDVAMVRDAANRARALSAMLSPEAAEKAKRAIEIARSAARKIVKAGESAAQEIDEAALRAIRQSRTAFLDLDEQAEVQTPSVTGRAIDLEATAETLEVLGVLGATMRTAAPAIELEEYIQLEEY